MTLPDLPESGLPRAPLARRLTPGPVVLTLIGVSIGSMMDAFVKSLAFTYPVLMLLFWRFAIGAVLVGVPFFASGRRLSGNWRTLRFHLIRGLMHAGMVSLFFYSLTQIPLAEATVLGFTAILMTAPLERLFLKERIHASAVAAAVLGFVGVLIIVQGPAPVAAEDTNPLLGRLAALMAACCYSCVLIMLRARSAEDGPFATAVYSNLMPALWLAIPVLWIYPLPAPAALPLFTAFAVIGTTVWVILSLAYAQAPAQKLAPLDYTSLLWAVALGWIFFGEVPPPSLYLGAGAIIGGCLLTLYGARRDARAAQQLTE